MDTELKQTLLKLLLSQPDNNKKALKPKKELTPEGKELLRERMKEINKKSVAVRQAKKHEKELNRFEELLNEKNEVEGEKEELEGNLKDLLTKEEVFKMINEVVEEKMQFILDKIDLIKDHLEQAHDETTNIENVILDETQDKEPEPKETQDDDQPENKENLIEIETGGKVKVLNKIPTPNIKSNPDKANFNNYSIRGYTQKGVRIKTDNGIIEHTKPEQKEIDLIVIRKHLDDLTKYKK